MDLLGGTCAGLLYRFSGLVLVYPADGVVLVKGKENYEVKNNE
jgi:hypothetical protein